MAISTVRSPEYKFCQHKLEVSSCLLLQPVYGYLYILQKRNINFLKDAVTNLLISALLNIPVPFRFNARELEYEP